MLELHRPLCLRLNILQVQFKKLPVFRRSQECATPISSSRCHWERQIFPDQYFFLLALIPSQISYARNSRVFKHPADNAFNVPELGSDTQATTCAGLSLDETANPAMM
jgi:hypothetical protein